MIASAGTSSPSAADTFLYLMRAPVRLSSWLKLTFLRDTAAYSLIGMLTSPKLMAPLQMALGIRWSIPVSTADAKGTAVRRLPALVLIGAVLALLVAGRVQRRRRRRRRPSRRTTTARRSGWTRSRCSPPTTPTTSRASRSAARRPSPRTSPSSRPPSSTRTPPLTEQLDLGLRSFELDLFEDPDGGRYARTEGPGAPRPRADRSGDAGAGLQGAPHPGGRLPLDLPHLRGLPHRARGVVATTTPTTSRS